MESSDKISIGMVAGEVSGDLLAGRMLSALRTKIPDLYTHGIGGETMIAEGFISDFPIEKLSVRGLVEVLAHYWEIKGIHNKLRDGFIKEKPSVFIGIDSPDFNIPLELKLREFGIPTIHFVSPSIWAWRPGRIKKIAEAVSHMMVLFPFEEKLYKDAGVPVTYVGHPTAEVIPMKPDIQAARNKLNLPQNASVVAVLPGSRISELNFHLPDFFGAIKLLSERDKNIRFVAPMAGDRQYEYFVEAQKKLGFELDIQVIRGESHTAIAAADTVLTSSGTATLEIALFKKPMVIAYKINWLTWNIVRRMVTTKWAGLPNILFQESVVPELLQNDMTPQSLADAVWKQLNDHNYCENLRQRFTELHNRLLRNTTELSSQVVLDVMRNNGK